MGQNLPAKCRNIIWPQISLKNIITRVGQIGVAWNVDGLKPRAWRIFWRERGGLDRCFFKVVFVCCRLILESKRAKRSTMIPSGFGVYRRHTHTLLQMYYYGDILLWLILLYLKISNIYIYMGVSQNIVPPCGVGGQWLIPSQTHQRG